MIAFGNDAATQRLSEHVSRRVLAHCGGMMLVEFRFRKGGVGQPHRHAEHEQIGYILEGVFEVISGDETKVLRAGDCYYAGINELHGVVALEDGRILDAFTPVRQDFL
jgi:quercetin dioxygenase-like cupin family protein